MHYLIRNADGDYWCNHFGWADKTLSSAYVNTNPSLPMGGRWCNVPNWVAYHIAMGKLRDDADTGDMWGWAMSWMFDMCGFLMIEREIRPPDEVQYRPGALGPDVVEDEWKRSILRDLTDDQIVHCLKVLNRYTNLLRKYGEDY